MATKEEEMQRGPEHKSINQSNLRLFRFLGFTRA